MMGENTVIVTICVAYFLVMIGTGIYASRKNKKASDFLVAGRRLNTCLLYTSILRNGQEFWNVPMTIRQLHSLTNVFAISVSMLRQDAPLKISVR